MVKSNKKTEGIKLTLKEMDRYVIDCLKLVDIKIDKIIMNIDRQRTNI